MPFARLRTRNLTSSYSGKWYDSLINVWKTETGTQVQTESCEDVVGNFDGDNPFVVEKRFSAPCFLQGRTTSGSIFDGTPLALASAISQVPQHRISNALLTGAELDQLATAAIGKTSPHANSVNLPTFVGELRELPAVFKNWGLERLYQLNEHGEARSLRVKTAQPFESYLTYRWGILPMMSDLRKMTQFTCIIRKRMRQLDRLAQGETIGRAVTLDGSYSEGVNPSQTLWSQRAFAYSGPRTDRTTQKSWATVRWSLADDAPTIRLPSDKLYREAVASVYGLTPEGLGKAAWELLPWSWFIDWFTSFGDLLDAIQGSLGRLPMQYKRVCVMRSTRTVRSAGPYSNTTGVAVGGAFSLERITKVRRPIANPNPATIYVPILSADKWSILSSLAAVKLLRKPR